MTPMNLTQAIVALFVLVATSGQALADTIASSDFSADADGWRVGEFESPTSLGNVQYSASGGNSGGFIRTDDQFSYNAFVAPAKFLGDMSSAFGGTLSFDERILSSDRSSSVGVIISDGTLLLAYFLSPPTTNWTSRSISLMASAGWELLTPAQAYNDLHGSAATDAQLQQVLGSLSSLPSMPIGTAARIKSISTTSD